jgi:hypothetical protein
MGCTYTSTERENDLKRFDAESEKSPRTGFELEPEVRAHDEKVGLGPIGRR